MEAKSKLLFKRPDGTWDFSHCRRTSVSQLYRAGLESMHLCYDIPTSAEVCFILGHVIAINLLREYIGYIPQNDGTSQVASSYIDGTVLTLAWLDAIVSTAI